MKEWMFNGSFAKICCRVDSLHELMEIADKARKAGLEVHVVTDSGKTEFKEPTVTCLAIGPDTSEKIDPITGHLKLL
jgi:PTH2 family peptidyl-tRNA hydrolase